MLAAFHAAQSRWLLGFLFILIILGMSTSLAQSPVEDDPFGDGLSQAVQDSKKPGATTNRKVAIAPAKPIEIVLEPRSGEVAVDIAKITSARERLKQQVSIKSRDQSFQEVLKQLLGKLQVNYWIDSEGWKDSGASLQWKCFTDYRHVSAGNVLKHLLSYQSLSYYWEGVTLVISVEEACMEPLVTKVYDIRDLLSTRFQVVDPRTVPTFAAHFPTPISQDAPVEKLGRSVHVSEEFDMEQLHHTIPQLIGNNDWQNEWHDNGGRNQLEFFRGRAIVNAPENTQAELSALLQAIRDLAHGKAIDCFVEQYRKHHDQIRERLNHPISVEWREIPLHEARNQLEAALDVTLLFDPVVLEAAEVSLEYPITLSVKDKPIQKVLNDLLAKMQCDYCIQNEMIQIQSIDSNGPNLVCRAYNVRDLVGIPLGTGESQHVEREAVKPSADRGEKSLNDAAEEPLLLLIEHPRISGGAGPAAKCTEESWKTYDLEKLLASSVQPANWSWHGGQGELSGYHGVLFVLQTEEMQAEIAKLISQLRKPIIIGEFKIPEGPALPTMPLNVQRYLLPSGKYLPNKIAPGTF